MLTTPIYYVNGAPHIGHAYTTVIADSVTRWARLCGRPAYLITGTDEHGLKVARAAAAAGLPPQTLADHTAARFRSTWDTLGIGYDDFVRTSEPRHRAVATELLRRVYDAGHIYRDRYTGRYCVACEAYQSVDVCPVHHRPTERVSEENWFFRLSAFAGPLARWFERSPGAVRPRGRRNEALGLLRQGLADFSVSRATLTWGVPLPWDPGQVAYVWFDALGSYLTAAGWPDPAYRERWPAHHLIGKDILRFHAIYWPAILLAAGLEPPDRITVHGFLLQRGEKIAKSGAGTVALPELIAGVGAEGLRYHLLRDNPVGPDGDFSYGGVITRYNADLANTLGNLLARVSAVIQSRCAGVAPAPALTSALSPVAARCADEAGEAWEDVRPSDALTAAWRLVAAANSALVVAAPWRAPAGSPEADAVLGDVVEALRLVAILAYPAIPGAAQEIWRRLGLPETVADQRVPGALAWGGHAGGLRITKGPPLFPRKVRNPGAA